MKTIGGGTIRYVSVSLLPCPEDPTLVGHCQGRATLELVRDDRLAETFTLVDGDQLLVADGAAVAPGTRLVADSPWLLRADLPPDVEAIAQWSEPVEELGDDVTGLAAMRFPLRFTELCLELHDCTSGATLGRHKLWAEDLTPLVQSGTVVRRGDRLALKRPPSHGKHCTSLPLLRAFLDARRLAHPQVRAALVSRCDGTVEAIDTLSVTLRTSDRHFIRLRRPSKEILRVQLGDPVRAGEHLTFGERSHHALLHILGDDALADHMLQELAILLGASVPRVYWSLVLRAMLDWRRIHAPGDTGMPRNAVISLKQLDEHQRATRALGGTLATATPALRGIGSIARERRRPRAR
jgi:hypothetical protein